MRLTRILMGLVLLMSLRVPPAFATDARSRVGEHDPEYHVSQLVAAVLRDVRFVRRSGFSSIIAFCRTAGCRSRWCAGPWSAKMEVDEA
jgi:hypothetical protein